MPIVVEHQPNAGTIGQLAYAGGLGDWNKYLQQLQQQQAQLKLSYDRLSQEAQQAELGRRFQAEQQDRSFKNQLSLTERSSADDEARRTWEDQRLEKTQTFQAGQTEKEQAWRDTAA